MRKHILCIVSPRQAINAVVDRPEHAQDMFRYLLYFAERGEDGHGMELFACR